MARRSRRTGGDDSNPPPPAQDSGVVAMNVTINSVTISATSEDGQTIDGATMGKLVSTVMGAIADAAAQAERLRRERNPRPQD